MEADPWANAWQSSTTSLQDDEQDIGSKWEPPSWNHNGSLWDSATNDDGKVWTSAHDNLPLGKSTEHLPEVPPPAEEPPDDETDSEFQLEPDDEIPRPPSPTRSPPTSPPGSPDAFGTFETGGLSAIPTISDAHWSSAQDSSEVAWGGAWAAEDEAGEQGPEDEEEAQAVDEWEAAKQQKAQQDKHVPPELLASILDQITEIFPAPPPTELDPADYRASRHKGLDVPVNSTYNRILPTDLTLPPTRPFPKSAVAKSTADALRLSRNAAFIRCSPLSHYSSTKGSTAWEASVKRRPDATGEPDLLPAGWRIVETKAKEEPVVQKKHGGLLSFFGRRSGTPPVTSSGDGSPISPSSSPRASLDGSTKSSAQSTKSPTNTSSSASVKTISPTTSANTSPKPPPAPAAPPLQEIFTAEDLDPSAGAPSAVSRFLGRFGRKSTGPKNLALSDGDFNFLSDIEGAVPNASGFAPITDFSMSTALLDDPVPLPAKLAPPSFCTHNCHATAARARS
ncbi:hypothetical protein MKEN_00878100 [Mycena kentingensis (nom. inval.)]|nr:hypothetical protein MKEN_00878100 [Mycena kentingensis (nom. inval.)]